jgi:hypothetical protein
MEKWNKKLITSLLLGALALPAVAFGQQPGTPAQPAQPAPAPVPAVPAPAAQDATVQAGDNNADQAGGANGGGGFWVGNGNRALLRAQVEAERAAVANARLGGVWAARGGKKEKAAFLGVVAVPADPAMRSQLKLPRGIGLVINQINDNTPAATAGIQEHDIFTKLDDQWLVSSQQLGVLIRMHKAGDEITLTGLREGQPVTVKAKLEEKEMVINDNGDQMLGWNVAMPAQVDFDKVKDFQGLVIDGDDAALVIKDNDQTLKVSMKDGERHLVATDGNGTVLFDGPVETEDQRKSLPADLSEKLEKYKEQFDQVKENGPGNTHKVRIIKDKDK